MAFFENPQVPSDILIPFRDKGKYGYCTYAGEQRYPAKMTALYPKPVLNSRELKVYMIVEEEKVGLIGPGWKLRPRHQSIYSQGDNHWFVYNKKGKAGWLDMRDGKLLTKPKYDDLFYLQDGLVLARLANKYGLLSRKDMDTKSINELVPVAADSIRMTYSPARRIFCQYGAAVKAFDYDSNEKTISPTEVPTTEDPGAQRFHSPLWARENILDRLKEVDDAEMEVVAEGGGFGARRRNTSPAISFQDSTFEARVKEMGEFR